MCGIVGIVGPGAEAKNIEAMTSQISHRGPDFQSHWKTENLALGHARLSIIDLTEGANQPFVDPESGAVIVFNGEIYNFKEIRSTYLSKEKFQTSSDTEVLLKMYLKFGEDCLNKLNGMFAFAVYTPQDKKIFLARDQIGVKPLYIYQNNGVFAFSSEIKSFLRLEGFDRSLNHLAFLRYTSFLWSPGRETPFKKVEKILPGEALIIKLNGNIERRFKYYDLEYKVENLSIRDAVEMCREEVSKAVKRQMVADVPVGAFLSGGVDSSVINHYASQHSNSFHESFSINTDGFGVDGFSEDLPYARLMAKKLNLNLNVIDVDTSILDSYEKAIYYLDEPQADPAILNCNYICKLSREKNIKVLLSGAGGDDIFSGYRRHQAIRYDWMMEATPRFMRRSIEKLTAQLGQDTPFRRRLSKLFRGASLDQTHRICSHFLWADLDTIENLFDQDFLSEVNLEKIFSPFIETLTNQNLSNLNKMLRLEMKHFLADHNLNYTDKMAMSHGVEVRVPFLDLELVKFANKLPDNYKVHNGQAKWLLKKSMEGVIPHEILYRSKSGFGAPLNQWLKGPLNSSLKNLIAENMVLEGKMFNSKTLKSIYDKTMSDQYDYSYLLFSVVTIDKWLKSFTN